MSAERVTPLDLVDGIHALRNRTIAMFRAVALLPRNQFDAWTGLGLVGEELAERGFADLERMANDLLHQEQRR